MGYFHRFIEVVIKILTTVLINRLETNNQIINSFLKENFMGLVYPSNSRTKPIFGFWQRAEQVGQSNAPTFEQLMSLATYRLTLAD